MLEAARAGASAAADRFGMAGRGVIRVGGIADLVVFSPELITTFVPGPGTDHSLYNGRSVQGRIIHVFKNGMQVVRDSVCDEAVLSQLHG